MAQSYGKLALDIDDTISDTRNSALKEMLKTFGGPENLSLKELAAKYKFLHEIPYWQTPKIKKWLKSKSLSNIAQEKIAVIQNAQKFVKQIHNIIPIACYITSRPETVRAGTKKWLKKNHFPEAKLIMRPKKSLGQDGNKWKAGILKKLFPRVAGVIDDNKNLLKFLPRNYKGKIFLYGHKHQNLTQKNTVACPTWEDVLSAVKKTYLNN